MGEKAPENIKIIKASSVYVMKLYLSIMYLQWPFKGIH